MKCPLRIGVFNGKEYIGEALQYNNTYIGTILEVVPNRFVAFGSHVTQKFDNYKAAEEFVITEWNKLFNQN
jgi:hypothetical protein